MKYRLLLALDTVIHRVIPPFVPFPLWAWRICNALEKAERRE